MAAIEGPSQYDISVISGIEDSISELQIYSGALVPAAMEKKGLSFTLFPKRPLELRRAIWESALPGHRYIELRSSLWTSFLRPDYSFWAGYFSISPPDGYFDRSQPRWGAYYAEKVPNIFACHEAMSVVKEKYVPLKGNDGSEAVWCNPKDDIFCVRDPFSKIPIPNFGNLPDFIRLNLTHLILEVALVYPNCSFKELDLRILPGLRDIAFALESYQSEERIVGSKVPSELERDRFWYCTHGPDEVSFWEEQNVAFDLIEKFSDSIRQQQPTWSTPILNKGGEFIFESTRAVDEDHNNSA